MDAPDAPLDAETGPGPAFGRLRLVAKAASAIAAAVATPCVPREVVVRMAEGSISIEEIRGPARRLVCHLLRGCRDCAIAFGRVAGLPADSRGAVPLFHYDLPVDRGIRLYLQA